LAIIEIVIANKPAKIIVGDAPIQSCKWELLLEDPFFLRIKELQDKYQVPIQIMDFRRVTFGQDINKTKPPISEYLIFDLGKESELEPITSDKNLFRVTSYNPDRLTESHCKGTHKYCITKALFDADIIISIPKVKTHQKVGITCALKNLVGINGDKDYLPHHRRGGVDLGGDCYPGKNYLRFWAECSLDNANRNSNLYKYKIWRYLTVILWKLSNPKKVHSLSAAWYGNDTTWRMVMDLNKIAIWGKSDGTISSEPQRTLLSLCDGIIGGQGDGPLNPDPLPLGIISFTNNSYLNDICMGILLGFDIGKIPLLKSAIKKLDGEDSNIFWNGEKISLEGLKKYSITTIPPPGWIDYFSS
jgi:hypothetical protein